MRAFVGVPVPEGLIGPLVHLQDQLGFGRAVPEENLHLTLAFLDESSEARLRALHDRLCEISLPAPLLRPSCLGFYGGTPPTLIAADVAVTDALTALYRAVQSAARATEIPLPRRRFRPHITLSRFGRHKGPEDARQAALVGHALRLPAVQADRFALYASTLNPLGARYDILAEYPLPI